MGQFIRVQGVAINQTSRRAQTTVQAAAETCCKVIPMVVRCVSNWPTIDIVHENSGTRLHCVWSPADVGVLAVCCTRDEDRWRQSCRIWTHVRTVKVWSADAADGDRWRWTGRTCDLRRTDLQSPLTAAVESTPELSHLQLIKLQKNVRWVRSRVGKHLI